jgi:D-alanyl-D-alanine carboxypeptidase
MPARQALWQMAARNFQPRQLVAIATSYWPPFPPGERFAYSNTNYILLGLVVERITGDQLAAQLRQRILAPLKLADTELPGTQRRVRGRHLHGYAPPDQSWVPGDGPAGLVDVTQTNPSWSWAAGAMVSSTADLAASTRPCWVAGSSTPICSRRCVPPWTPASSSAPLPATAWACCGCPRLRRPGLGHGGELLGYATVALSSRDAARQLILVSNLVPAPGGAVQAAVEHALTQGLSC